MATKLFSCLFGSSLYGTQTPTSDLDIKHIILPSLGSLLVGRAPKNVVRKTNKEKNTRNSKDDIDEELIPIQVFARDFFAGQTYALEFAFALEGSHAGQTLHEPMLMPFITELRAKFLTSNIKAMMGYVVNQANMYSLKGERLNLLNEFEALFQAAAFDKTQKIEHLYADALQDDGRTDTVIAREFVKGTVALSRKYPKYFKIAEYDIGDGRMKPCFYVNEKVFPHTNTVFYSLEVLKTMMDKYGSRAEQAREINVDWKAMMHALRIVDEGLALLTTHKLKFPFPPATVEHYLRVKRGEIDIELVRADLGSKLERLKQLEANTTLKTSAELQAEFDTWLESWMFKFYSVPSDLKLRRLVSSPHGGRFVADPLTDEQIVNAMCEDGCERIESFYHVGPVQKAAVWSFARAIEQAHGIKGGNHDQTCGP